MQSLNSSEPDSSFASFLGRSLKLLERELPWGYATLCRVLGEREVLIEVDGEAAPILCTGHSMRVEQAPRAPMVECKTTREAILELVDAKATLVGAILADKVWLRGSVDDLLAFHDGLMAYLGGAVRSPSFPWLLQEFREGARSRRTRRADDRMGNEQHRKNGGAL